MAWRAKLRQKKDFTWLNEFTSVEWAVRVSQQIQRFFLKLWTWLAMQKIYFRASWLTLFFCGNYLCSLWKMVSLSFWATKGFFCFEKKIGGIDVKDAAKPLSQIHILWIYNCFVYSHLSMKVSAVTLMVKLFAIFQRDLPHRLVFS